MILRSIHRPKITGVTSTLLGRDLAMTKDLHRHTRMHVESGQQGPARLPGAVHGDPGDMGLDDAAIEAAAEVPRLQRRTVAGGEDQARFDPCSISPPTVGLLLLLTELERGHA